jgi:hypothetical protein
MTLELSLENTEKSECAVAHLRPIAKLTKEQLQQEYKLPCGCEKITLLELIQGYACSGCDEDYFYSFCQKAVVESNNTWHCVTCGDCKEASERHCKFCNKCSYGLTLPCENCGKKSPYN